MKPKKIPSIYFSIQVEASGLSSLRLFGDFFLGQLDPVSAYQQSVGVDAVGRAGDERHKVFVLPDLYGFDVGRIGDGDRVDRIGERIAQHMKQDQISFLHLV